MSTHCAIGILNDNKINSIYCLNDGYPSYVGTILYKNYSNKENLYSLLSLGNLSSLGQKPMGKKTSILGDKEYKTFHGCYVIRDDETKQQIYEDEYSFLFNNKLGFLDYAYLYVDGKWYIYFLGKIVFKMSMEVLCRLIPKVHFNPHDMNDFYQLNLNYVLCMKNKKITIEEFLEKNHLIVTITNEDIVIQSKNKNYISIF